MRFLRGDYAQSILLGPFLGEDGLTPQTGLTIAQANVKLSKNNAAFAVKNNAITASHYEDGHYNVPFNNVDIPYGQLRIKITVSGCLPFWEDFFVLDQVVYDAFMGTGKLPADVVLMDGQDPLEFLSTVVIAGFNLPVSVTLSEPVEVGSFSEQALITLQGQITPGARTMIFNIEETRS